MSLPHALPFVLGGATPEPPTHPSHYEDNPEFNATLDKDVEVDKENGNIIIAGVKFQASEILYEMDRIAYHDARVEYQAQKQAQQIERLKETILQQFPTPLAHHFDRIEYGWSDEGDRLDALQDFWEALIYVLYALVLGEARCKLVGLKGAEFRGKPLAAKNLLSRNLADKLDVIKLILEWESEHSMSTLSCSLIPLEAIARIHGLIKARNWRAHRESISEEQAKELFNMYFPEVLEICQLLSGLADVTIMRLGKTTNLQNPRFERFVGFAPNRRYQEVQLTPEQVTASLPYLHQNNVVVMMGNDIFSLSPFLHFVSASHGNMTRLCGYRQDISGGKYDFIVFGESTNEELPKSTFDKEDEELKTLLTTPPVKGNNP